VGRRFRLLLIVLMFATIGCDRVTKNLAFANLADSPPHSFLRDTFRLEYAENTGAFLSLGAELPVAIRHWVLIGAVSVVLCLLAIVALKQHWVGVPLAGTALIWAGGVSNLIDRVLLGRVVDFMNVGVGSLRTGIFNVADIAVMAGAVMILWGRREMPSS